MGAGQYQAANDPWCWGEGGGAGGASGGGISGYGSSAGLQANEQANEDAYVANLNAPTIQYYFEGEDGSVYEQQKGLAAITLGQLYAAQQGITNPDDIAAAIQDIYDSLQLAPGDEPKGGNFNFLDTVSIYGEDFSVTSLGCFAARCGMLDTLDYSHPGSWHIDTSNPWFFPIGSLEHLFVDLIGGQTWWSVGGIPRTP